MGKYIKVFDTHLEYESFKQSADYIEPNVSICTLDEDVHYNPIVIVLPLIVTYNVEDTSNPIPLFVGAESIGFSASAIYDKIEIDDVEIDISDLSSSEQEGTTFYSYQLTSGEHTVKYTLKDPTMIGAKVDEETGMPKIGAAFAGCRNIVSAEIPNTVLIIGRIAFKDCDGLSSLEIPNNVTSIEDGAFNNCSGLTSVTIPNSVTSIGIAAFQFCRNLTSVTIPNSVTTIGENAFYECSNLESVIVLPTTPPTLGNRGFSLNKNGRKIYVPAASVETYKAATNWSTYAADIQAIPTT